MPYDKQDYFFIEYLLENLPNCIFWKDKNLVFKWCNMHFARLFGYKNPKEIIGKSDYDFSWSPELRDKYINDDKQILSSGKAKLNYEEQQQQPDGSLKTVLVNKIPVYDKKHKVLGILGICTDITDHKKNEELYLKHEAAKKLAAFANRVTSSMAHELRTPLAIINTEADLISLALSSSKPQREKDESCRRAIKVIKDTVKSSAHVIDDMLVKIKNFSQEKMENTFKITAIATDVEEFLAAYPFQEGEKELVKLKNFDNPKNRFEYLGDSILTKHVLASLLKNALFAVKMAEKGEITIELRAGNANEKFNYLVFKDTALGIESGYINKIFDRFETKKNPRGSGVGLGLSFCKIVMENYAGDIVCDSKLGEYTQFTLSFPKLINNPLSS